MAENDRPKTMFQSDLLWLFMNEYLGNDLLYQQALKFNEKKHRINDDKLSYRTINHWSNNDLISDNRPQGKGWRKFSCSELTWLLIMRELRRFNFPLDKIKRVKESFTKFEDPKGISDMPYLDFFSLYAICTQIPVSIYVFADGEALISNAHIMTLNKQFYSVKNYIEIDLNHLLTELYQTDRIRAKHQNMAYLSIEELQVLDKLKDNGLSNLTIGFKDGRPFQMELHRKVENKESLTTNHDFGQTVSVKHQGKVIGYKETVIERF